ncbi:hypothetical protein PHYPSEUDO_003737 [Phytophthora pseudosyringae]|uniref:Ankyrin repeat-containing domain n=1 Tax=Phytophthora pseudosyringae TaxID=221518 RepID=A0A8T1VQ10_9STRA|nr:hypothetical protein PHYPSEUDO_003737 [Phytophthora pseudosyringae]
MVSNTCDLPVLAKVRLLGRHCLNGEMPHVLLTIDAMLDDFSAGRKAHEVYKRTRSLRCMQYVAAREPFEELDPFYRRAQFNRTVEIAAAAGHLAAVQWLVESYEPKENLTKTVAAAAANGHLHILQWLFDNHRGIGYWGATEMCGALLNEHAGVVEWLREHAVPRQDSLKKVMEAAAAAGNMEVVGWLFNDCHAKAEDALWSAQTSKQWGTARWILENCGLVGPWIDWDLPAKDGALSFLQYLRSRSIGGPGFYTLQVAAWNGHLEIVEWLHRELRTHRSEGFVFHRNSIIRLPLELMQWLIAHYVDNLHGCEFEVERCDWRFNDWCRDIKLRMAHQNELSVWWECSSETVRPEAQG